LPSWKGTALQRPITALMEKRPYRFILGLIIGSTIGGILVLSFSGNLLAAWIESIILSFVTYGGIALIIFGYLYKKNGQKTFVSDFALGVGIGLIVVWFVGAGNGTITSTPASE
jgi:peptidoglycan/LPS O-acetylase OafA/YrhL